MSAAIETLKAESVLQTTFAGHACSYVAQLLDVGDYVRVEAPDGARVARVVALDMEWDDPLADDRQYLGATIEVAPMLAEVFDGRFPGTDPRPRLVADGATVEFAGSRGYDSAWIARIHGGVIGVIGWGSKWTPKGLLRIAQEVAK